MHVAGLRPGGRIGHALPAREHDSGSALPAPHGASTSNQPSPCRCIGIDCAPSIATATVGCAGANRRKRASIAIDAASRRTAVRVQKPVTASRPCDADDAEPRCAQRPRSSRRARSRSGASGLSVSMRMRVRTWGGGSRKVEAFAGRVEKQRQSRDRPLLVSRRTTHDDHALIRIVPCLDRTGSPCWSNHDDVGDTRRGLLLAVHEMAAAQHWMRRGAARLAALQSLRSACPSGDAACFQSSQDSSLSWQ